MNYPKSDKQKMMKTNHLADSFAPMLIVSNLAKKRDKILDFGCGRGRISMNHLKQCGFTQVYGYDLVLSDAPAYGQFDYIYVQNVLNSIPSDLSLYLTLMDIAGFIKDDGVCIMDYPLKKRSLKMSNLAMKGLVNEVFHEVFTLTSDKKNHTPIWACKLTEDINEEV